MIEDEDKAEKALTVWDNERFSPKPASEHVALQEPVVRRRELRKPKRSGMCVAGWSLIGVALVGSVALLIGAI